MFIIDCPYCNTPIQITKLNCKIFIHGYRKDTMKQISPHSKLKYINKLKETNNLLGCGSKFYYDGNKIILYKEEDFNNY